MDGILNQYKQFKQQSMKTVFEVGQTVEVINIDMLTGNDKKPNLKIGGIHEIKEIVLDKDGNQHLDVGLVSRLSYVKSWETGEELPNGNKIHWCHPSRFRAIEGGLEA